MHYLLEILNRNIHLYIRIPTLRLFVISSYVTFKRVEPMEMKGLFQYNIPSYLHTKWYLEYWKEATFILNRSGNQQKELVMATISTVIIV